MVDPTMGWMLFAYLAGSVATGVMVYRSTHKNAIGQTIDNLILKGYLKTRKTEGEIEILKYNEEQV